MVSDYVNAYGTWRYSLFNLPEEFVGIFGDKCYNGLTYPSKICEAGPGALEELNPQTAYAAKQLFLDKSVSSEVPVANSPDDFQDAGTTDGTYSNGLCTFGSYLNVNIEIPNATYAPRNGYYRCEMIIENQSQNPDSKIRVQNYSACDNFTVSGGILGGRSGKIEFPFYYDDSVTNCPSGGTNEGHIHFLVKLSNGTPGETAVIKSIKFYEVNPS